MRDNRASGQTLTEYVLILTLLAVACLLSVTVFGNQVREIFFRSSAELRGPSAARLDDQQPTRGRDRLKSRGEAPEPPAPGGRVLARLTPDGVSYHRGGPVSVGRLSNDVNLLGSGPAAGPPEYGYWEAEFGDDPYSWYVHDRRGKRSRRKYREGGRWVYLKERQQRIWRKWKEEVNQAYPRDPETGIPLRVVGIAQAAARETGIPFEWIMGSIMLESSGFEHSSTDPDNTYGTSGIPGPSGREKGKIDSGQGLTQMQTPVFDKTKAWSEKQDEHQIWWNHSDLINPQLAVWSAALALKEITGRRAGGRVEWVRRGFVRAWWMSGEDIREVRAYYGGGKRGEKPRALKIEEEHYWSARVRALKEKDVSAWMQPGDDQFPKKEKMRAAR